MNIKSSKISKILKRFYPNIVLVVFSGVTHPMWARIQRQSHSPASKQFDAFSDRVMGFKTTHHQPYHNLIYPPDTTHINQRSITNPYLLLTAYQWLFSSLGEVQSDDIYHCFLVHWKYGVNTYYIFFFNWIASKLWMRTLRVRWAFIVAVARYLSCNKWSFSKFVAKRL